MRSKQNIKLILEETYTKFHHREFVEPDPLQFLYPYSDVRDREISGIIASCLALGRVGSIIKIINEVLEKLPSPFENLMTLDPVEISELFSDFKYRFYIGNDLVDLLLAIKKIIKQYGSLNNCFLHGYRESHASVLPALLFFVNSLYDNSRLKMIADPSKSSACKRLMLYLRWMVRNDEIDPGGWQGIPRSKLIIPLDTHMRKISRMLKLSTRNDGGIKTALEITKSLQKYDPLDPIRFDFSLTRPGIHPDLNYDEFSQQ
ncbi:MAG: TIGR02757 family protein [Spirochaetaceae bacterium]|nr:TIGR02757 family protein [Spirochaetaceae bacterium]